MIKKIFKGIFAVVRGFVYLMGLIATYMLLISVLWGKGELKWHVPFTEDQKVWTWDNTGGSK